LALLKADIHRSIQYLYDQDPPDEILDYSSIFLERGILLYKLGIYDLIVYYDDSETKSVSMINSAFNESGEDFRLERQHKNWFCL